MNPTVNMSEFIMTDKSTAFSDIIDLQSTKVAKGDPVLRWLTGTKASPIVIGVAYSLLFILLRLLAALCAGHLRTSGTVTGFVNDPAVIPNVISGAVVCAYYVWIPRGIVMVFQGLYDNRVIGGPKKDKQEKYSSFAGFLEEMQDTCGERRWPVISFVVSIGVTIFLMLPRYLSLGQSAWWTATTINLLLSLLWIMAGLYFVLLMLIYLMLCVYWLSKLFDAFSICVRPLYPDRAGGLGPLGSFTLTLSYIIVLVAVMLMVASTSRYYVETGAFEFRWTTDLLVGLGFYVVVTPLAFFSPLSVAHKAMKDAKAELLLKIAEIFGAEYRSIQNAFDGQTGDISGLEESLKVLGQLQVLYDTTSGFPVWPFNLSNVMRFVTSYVSPIVLALLVDLLGKIVNP